MSSSIKAVLYKSKTLANGEHPVMLRIIKERKIKYISIGFSCTKELWNFEENVPKKKHPLYKEAKILIAKRKLEADKIVLGLESDEKNLSAHELKKKLTKEKSQNFLVYEYFDNVINRLRSTGNIKTAEVYKDTKKNMENFYPSPTLHFSDIDVQFLNKWEEHLKINGKGDNTRYIYFRTLRALINKAIKEEVCNEKHYPFKNFSLAKYTKIKTVKRAISKDEIIKIANFDAGGNPKLIDAKNTFLFSYYCRGINFIDIAYLKWGSINNGRISYTRSKTKEFFNMELLSPAIEILNYYKPATFLNSESYIFPFIKQTHNTPSTIYNRKLKMLRRVNEGLKDIALALNISSNLTTYVARHSYATIMKKSGVSTSIISQAMGHDSEKTTQIYLETFENAVVDDASKLIL